MKKEFKAFNVDFVAFLLHVGKKYSYAKRASEDKICFYYEVDDDEFKELLELQYSFYEGEYTLNLKQFFIDRKKIIATISSIL